MNGAAPSPTRTHHQPKSVQRAEKRLGVTTEFTDLSLHSASANGNLGLVKYALLNGQPVNSILNGVLPLHAAASFGNETIVLMLLEHGADVDSPRLPRRYSNDRTRSSGIAVGTAGSTPLHFAAANNHSNVVALLLSHGAKVSATEKYGLTPEALAIQKGHIDVAELLRAWADDDAEVASSASGGNSLRSLRKKRMHPQRSFDTLALKLSQHTSSPHLPPIFATSSSSSLNLGNQTASPNSLSFASSRRGSVSSQYSDQPSHRRPSLPAVFERAAHPAASLKAALGRRRQGSESKAGTADDVALEDSSRRRSEETRRLGRKGSIGGSSLDERPTTAPHGKTSFYPAELASSASTTSSMPTANSSTSSLATPIATNPSTINTSLANTFYRPRQSSQLSGGSRGGSTSARSPSTAQVFVDDDEDEDEDDESETDEDPSQVVSSPRSSLLPSPLGLAHARESSAASSSVASSQPSPTRFSTPEGAGTSADNSDEGSREGRVQEEGRPKALVPPVEPRRTIVRDRTNSVGSTSSSFSRGPSSVAASSPLRHSHSNDLMPVDRRYETRTSRSNSAGTDGRFSSSPASSYSAMGTLSTYAPSNSTAPTSVGPSSPPTQQHAARQPFLSPLYESGPFVAKAQDPGSPPVTTSAQARSKVKKAEQELRAYSTLASSSSSGTRPTLSQQLAAYGQSLVLERKLAAQETQLTSAYHYETIGQGGSRTAPIGERRAEGRASSLTPNATPMPKSPLRVVVEPTKTPQWRAIPTDDRLMPPPTIHHHHRSDSPTSSVGRERVKEVPKPTLAAPPPSIPPLPRASNPPTRASSPSSTSSSVVLGGTNGVSYVEVSSPPSGARSLRPPRSSGAGGKSDRTHSQKGGSVTSSKDQVLLDAAEQARIAAAIPQAQITTGSTKQAKKGFARRLFSSVKM